MKALIVTPSVSGTLGNSITAQRWGKILGDLGHQVTITHEWTGEACDFLIALHARRSNSSIERFRAAHPRKPLIAALTGTDLYSDLRSDPVTRRSLQQATRIVGLQSRAGDELNEEERTKLRVIYQSAVPPRETRPDASDRFDICVLSHLRDVKDPLRAAWAARLLDKHSQIRIVHAGRALDAKSEEMAREEERVNSRYKWLGEISHDAAMQLLAGSRLLIVSSELEGGANVISEAVVCGVPVLCSAVAGNIGMLGEQYIGYFPLKDTDALAALLHRAETDLTFMRSLRDHIEGLRERFSPDKEREDWARLIEEVTR